MSLVNWVNSNVVEAFITPILLEVVFDLKEYLIIEIVYGLQSIKLVS